MSSMDQFHFHLKCQSLKLAHPCLADDLILGCKGEFSCVYLLLQAFNLFLTPLGINQINVSKSDI